jgi:hypothetical protein
VWINDNEVVNHGVRKCYIYIVPICRPRPQFCKHGLVGFLNFEKRCKVRKILLKFPASVYISNISSQCPSTRVPQGYLCACACVCVCVCIYAYVIKGPVTESRIRVGLIDNQIRPEKHNSIFYSYFVVFFFCCCYF